MNEVKLYNTIQYHVFKTDADNYITINAITSTSSNLTVQFSYDAVYSYDSVSGGTTNIDKNNVMITTDIICYCMVILSRAKALVERSRFSIARFAPQQFVGK